MDLLQTAVSKRKNRNTRIQFLPNLFHTDNVRHYPTTLPPTKGETMVGTLWKSASGICVCTEHKDGFIFFVYLDNPQATACSHESTLHTYYTQLIQPQEET